MSRNSATPQVPCSSNRCRVSRVSVPCGDQGRIRRSIDMRAKGLAVWSLLFLMVASARAASERDVRLLEAVKNTDRAAVRSLVQHHVDVNVSDLDGTTALNWAVELDDVETAQLLLR